MIITDRVYGEVEITEPVLLELIASSPLQRLKGIDQHGTPNVVCPNGNVSRYEHCVGTMLLIRHFKGSVEEQIAGLLHDVPHTVFSHVIDFVFDDHHDQEFHEKFYEKIVLDSEIPSILEKYGFDVNRVIDHHLFGLLERSKPDLCCDRLDYTLRDTLAYDTTLSLFDTGRFLSSMIVHEGEIIFSNPIVALDFARHYMNLNAHFWATPKYVVSFELLARAIKRGMDIGLLHFDDLFLTDDVVYQKLIESSDFEIKELLLKLTPSIQVEVVSGDEDQVEQGSRDFLSESFDYETSLKFRHIDPKVLLDDGGLKRVSEIYSEYDQELKMEKERFSLGFKLRIVSY